MSSLQSTVQHYRLTVRSLCRVLSMIFGLLAVSHVVAHASAFALSGFPGAMMGLASSGRALSIIYFGALAFLFWRFDQRLARWIVPEPTRGGCPQCGYSLKGLGDRPICPECGADVRPPSPSPTIP